jgi:hypothetical protein
VWLVEWEAAHGAPLTFDLVFSDPQRRAFPVARNLTANRYELDTRHLPGGGECRVALLATDGIRSDTARSAPFVLPARSPTLVILAPADGEEIMADQPFSLIGRALDAGGQSLPEAGLVWSVDGHVIARGTMLSLAHPLAPGRHVVELRYAQEGMPAATARHEIRVPPRSAEHEAWLRVQRELAASGD